MTKGKLKTEMGGILNFFHKNANLNILTIKHIKNAENQINNLPIRKFVYKTAF
jgi:IS30 family transposase